MTGSLVPLSLAVAEVFPRPLSSYPAMSAEGLGATLMARVRDEPFNLFALLTFAGAITHTFLTPLFRRWAREAEAKFASGGVRSIASDTGQQVPEVSFVGQILHFLGEVEAVFGLWAIVLAVGIIGFKGTGAAVEYIGSQVNYTEPLFVMVIMALASTRPIMRLAENLMMLFASLGGQTTAAWWLSILIVGPLLGSLITEPGAMTICALLLARHFYHYNPSLRLKYATIGLLFVNVSVGGTLTHFSAPPIIMVASAWHWGLGHVFFNFGWRAMEGIVVSTSLYYLVFRKEFDQLDRDRLQKDRFLTIGAGTAIPLWIIVVQAGFIAYCVAVSHYPPLFLGGFLFFLAFAQATLHHQKKLELRSSLLVGFFLAGLVVHGGLQAWWLQPVISSLSRTALFWGATFLTSFNDNAAITYLATLVPNLGDALRYAVVAGAVTGGGLTVIANAPNPAGQSILQEYFPDGVSPVRLAVWAVVPTLVMAAAFMAF